MYKCGLGRIARIKDNGDNAYVYWLEFKNGDALSGYRFKAMKVKKLVKVKIWKKGLEMNEGKGVNSECKWVKMGVCFWVCRFNTACPIDGYGILKVYGGYGVSIFMDMVYPCLRFL
nr:hypothetical protein [Tanacetum cinerariifolium]